MRLIGGSIHQSTAQSLPYHSLSLFLPVAPCQKNKAIRNRRHTNDATEAINYSSNHILHASILIGLAQVLPYTPRVRKAIRPRSDLQPNHRLLGQAQKPSTPSPWVVAVRVKSLTILIMNKNGITLWVNLRSSMGMHTERGATESV